MRILILSKYDIQGCCNLNQLFALLSPCHSLRALLSDDLLPEERGNPHADCCTWHDRDFLKNAFFPLLDQAAPPADAALLTFQGLERRYNTPVRLLEHGRHNDQLLAALEEFRPDLVYACRFDYILPAFVLERMQGRCINTHSGPLPQCRGPNASFWAMRLGYRQTACSLHRITPHIDCGPLLAGVPVPLDYSRCLFWNRQRIYRAGIAAFGTVLSRLAKGEQPPEREQNPTLRRYYAFPDAAAFQAFTEAGKKLYDAASYLEILARFLPSAAPGPQLPGGSLAAWYAAASREAGLHALCAAHRGVYA